MLEGEFSHIAFPSLLCLPSGGRGLEQGASPEPRTHPAPNQPLAEHVLFQPSWFCSQPAPSVHIKAFSRSELLLASRAPVGPHHPPHGCSPRSTPRLAPAPPPRSKPCQGHGKSARSLRGKSVQMRPSKRVGRDGEGGAMTPGLALLFPSLMFPANNPVNAQEWLRTSPAPRLGGVWGRWVPDGGDSPRPAPTASPQPPGPEQAPSRDGGRAVSPDISICFGDGWGGRRVEGAGGTEGLTAGLGREQNPPRTWRGKHPPVKSCLLLPVLHSPS